MSSFVECAACIDEALLRYQTSFTEWEKATDYIFPSATASPRDVPDPGVKLRAVHSLPDAFLSQYRNVQYRSFMGLFSQIQRAWLTIDNKLFLWAYGNRTDGLGAEQLPQNTDLLVYDEIQQIIVSVALVRPRPNVFVESVPYLLAVATGVDVTLLAVSFTPSGEISLSPTHISVATDGVLMLKILSSADGRIFMAGSDGSIHEMVYESHNHPAMFSFVSNRGAKRVRRIVHARSALPDFFPAMLRSMFARSDETIDLAIDDSRAALYSLSQGGSLSVYDISEPRVTRHIRSVNVVHASRSLISFSVPLGEREFVSIHALGVNESVTVHLVVVTSLGERIYFSTASGASMASVASMPLNPTKSTQNGSTVTGPKTLTCVGYRPSPDPGMSRSSLPCVHMAFCDRGAFIVADLRETESDRLIYAYPDVSLVSPSNRGDSRPGTSKTAEVVVEKNLGRDSAIAGEDPFHGHSHRSSKSASITRGPSEDESEDRQNALTRTFAIAEARTDGASSTSAGPNMPSQPPSLFWVLTSTCICLYERMQPVDRLVEIFRSQSMDSTELETFFRRYGAAEACAMCLNVAASQSAHFSAAANAFYAYGNGPRPEARQSSAEHPNRKTQPKDVYLNRPSNPAVNGVGDSVHNGPARASFDVGRPSLQYPLFRSTGAFEGTCMFLAKTLEQLWNHSLTSCQGSSSYESLVTSKEVIDDLRQRFSAVVSLLSNYASGNRRHEDPVNGTRGRTGSGGPRSANLLITSGPTVQGDNALPFDQRARDFESERVSSPMRICDNDNFFSGESDSMYCLEALCRRIIEALALLRVLADHQLHRVTASMSEQRRGMLSKMTFRDLVISEEGKVLASSLIEAIISSHSDAQGAVQRIGGILRDRCGTYFQDSDFEVHRGLALLREAVKCAGIVDQSGNIYDVRITAGHEGDYLDSDRSLPSASHARALAEEAAKILKSVPDRIFDITTVCKDLLMLNALPALVSIALSIGKAAEVSSNLNRASIAYESILTAFRSTAHSNRVESFEQLPPADDSASLKDAALNLALNSKSRMFLEKLYEFLLESKAGEELLMEHTAPFLESYLEENNKLDLLWRYSAKHRRYVEAAGILLKMAESEPGLKLIDRIKYLSCAVHNAKTAASKDDNRSTPLLAEILDYLDVAKVQLRTREELSSRNAQGRERERALQQLDGVILNVSELFNKYCRPFHLHEASLAALHCSGYRDDAYVRGLWRSIIEREAASVRPPNAVSEKIINLSRDFYPSDVAFPTPYILDLLERMVYSNKSAPLWKDTDSWVYRTMRQIGVPTCEIIDGYRQIVETPQTVSDGDMWSWTQENAQLHVLVAIERAVSSWVARSNRSESNFKGEATGSCLTTLRSDADRILTIISLCKSRIRGMGAPMRANLVERFDALEMKIAPIGE